MPVASTIIFALLAIYQGEATFRRKVVRIVNGQVAALGEFPYQVGLRLYGENFCSGSILDKFHILTAAHCVVNESWKDYRVIVGTVNLRSPAAVHNVSDAIVHEQYDADDSWKNDIAILKLATPIAFNAYVQPARLPRPGLLLRDNQKAMISGFGRLGNGGSLPAVMYKTEVYIENQKDCRDHYTDDLIRRTNVCVQNKRRTTGFCKADSGGPLTLNGRVIGIISFSLGNGCATDTREPQVLTRVSEYIGWIKSKLNS